MVSPSELNLFYQCPQRWYWLKQGLYGLQISSPEAEIGKNVHFIIYLYFTRLTDTPKEEDIPRLVNQIYSEIGNSSRKVRNLLDNFIEFEKKRLRTWENYLPELVEQRFVITDELTGIVDFYGNNTVIDWKTGRYFYTKPEDVRQGNIYRYLLEKAGYKVDKILFVYLKENKVVEIPRKLDGEIEEEINRMKRMFEVGYLPKKKGVHCNWCEYQIRCEFDEEGITIWKL